MKLSLGVDIGGTKIASGIVDEEGHCVYRTEVPSDPSDREKMFRQVASAIQGVLQQSGYRVNDLEGIGIGVPGKVDPEKGLALFQNNIPWTNFPLVERIKERFPTDKVVIDNDVYMATFAEWVVHGKVINEIFVYVTVSTGIACCTIHNGEFIRGAGFAGEIGFLPVSVDSSQRLLSLESVASGPGIVRMAKQSNMSAGEENLTPRDIMDAYRKRSPYAVKLINNVMNYLARGIYAVSCLVDPHKLVLGGGIINGNPDLLDVIKDALRDHLVPDQKDFLNRMYTSRLKGDAGVIGAGLKAIVNF